ncbi:LysE family translocator [Cognatishimia sp. SS12]|uniref:LysE family translocator n=1 Tax=Cognatishimia sp. SS12 TaxID=2979465 RepID=UPI0023314A92|nr:LysE family translocator [Cognatishimia sp. SS12]MDC0737427.1 LysE family translocator [Cognatishimia sp. SS12]
MTLTAFLASWLLCLAAAMTPGPAVLMSARIGLREGLATGTALAAGIGAGAVFWASTALFGLSILFDYAPSLLIALKGLGAAYLCYLAYKKWRHADEPMQAADTSIKARSKWAAFKLGVLTQLSNPKGPIFFGAVFAGTIPDSAPLWVLACLLGLIFTGETLWNIAVVRIFSFEKTRKGYTNLKGVFDRVFGGALAILGLKIAAT